MINLLPHLRIVGSSLIALSVAHLYFARHLEWRKDAALLTPVNRQIFYVHAFFICLILAMMGALCLFAPHTLLTPTPLSRHPSTTALVNMWDLRNLLLGTS